MAEETEEKTELDEEILTLMKKRDEKLKSNVPETMNELIKKLKFAGDHWRKDFTKGHSIRPRGIADILERYITFAVIGSNEFDLEKAPLTFYDLDEGIYTTSIRELDKLILAVERDTTVRQRKEVRDLLRIEAPEKQDTDQQTLIAVGNGVYNQLTETLEPFDSKYVFRSKVSTNYEAEAKEPVFNGWQFSKWVKEIADGDGAKEKLIWQALACAVNSNYNMELAFILVDDGQGRTGKSTFENLLINLVGGGNFASLKIKEFEEQFKLASASGKALIIGDDNNPNDYNATSENFKSAVTGDVLLINPKGMPPFTTKFNCLVVQSANGMPRFSDNTDALLRRFRVIKFNHQYPATSDNKKIKSDYIKDQRLLEFILNKALQIRLDQTPIQDTEESQKAIYDIKLENDVVAYFVENYMSKIKSDRIPSSFLFKLFLATMKYENNPQSMRQNTFTKRVQIPLKKIGWLYESKNLKLSKYWDKEDYELLNQYDPENKYDLLQIETHKNMPLFERRENLM